MNKTARIGFRIEEPVLEALEYHAHAKGVSVSHVAREIVKRSMRAQKPLKKQKAPTLQVSG